MGEEAEREEHLERLDPQVPAPRPPGGGSTPPAASPPPPSPCLPKNQYAAAAAAITPAPKRSATRTSPSALAALAARPSPPAIPPPKKRQNLGASPLCGVWCGGRGRGGGKSQAEPGAPALRSGGGEGGGLGEGREAPGCSPGKALAPGSRAPPVLHPPGEPPRLPPPYCLRFAAPASNCQKHRPILNPKHHISRGTRKTAFPSCADRIPTDVDKEGSMRDETSRAEVGPLARGREGAMSSP